MYHTFDTTKFFIQNFLKIYTNKKNIQIKVIIAPSYPFLHIAQQICKNTSLYIAAQNMHYADEGSYTGEISAAMLKSIGIQKVILGHNECRKYLYDNEEILLKKIKQALKYKLKIIFCIGETLIERNNGEHFKKIKIQIEKTLFHLSLEELESITISYEPIWAIGTEKNATPKQAQEMHSYIRKIFLTKYNKSTASKIYILYGGNVNFNNAKLFFIQKDIDGVLIGRSSVNVNSFYKIIEIYQNLLK